MRSRVRTRKHGSVGRRELRLPLTRFLSVVGRARWNNKEIYSGAGGGGSDLELVTPFKRRTYVVAHDEPKKPLSHITSNLPVKDYSQPMPQVLVALVCQKMTGIRQ